MENVKFLFDFGSPNAYLAHKVIPAIVSRTGAVFEYVPVLLGGIFKMTGNQSPATAFAGIRNKPDYDKLEMKRFMARHAITTFMWNPNFPMNSLQLMRAAVAAQAAGVLKPYVEAVFAGMWERGLKMDDVDVVRTVLTDAGLPVAELLAASQTDPVKAALLANTESAVAAGVFGAPSFLVRDELFFGKDRLRDVEEEIVRLAGKALPAST